MSVTLFPRGLARAVPRWLSRESPRRGGHPALPMARWAPVGVGQMGESQDIMSCWKGYGRLFSFPGPVAAAFTGPELSHLSCTVTGGQRST